MQTYYWKLQNNEDDKKFLKQAADFIRQGEVVAFPTETVYGLGADGLNAEAVAKIFKAKGRPNDNPLILHIAEKDAIMELTKNLTDNAKLLIDKFWPGPLTIIAEKSAVVPEVVSAGLETVAVRFPSNIYAQMFIKECGCPIAAPSANISGRPSPTNAQDVFEDMSGKIAAILDGGSCGIGLESTVVDTTEPIPVILRPGGITYEMLTEAIGAVEIDPALYGDKDFKPKAPGMKYRHYAPKATMYLLEGKSKELLDKFVKNALSENKKVGVLCSAESAKMFTNDDRLCIASWGESKTMLAENLFYLLRDFDRTCPDVILAESVDEDDIGLAVMNRMRKAAGYQLVYLDNTGLHIKNGAKVPDFMLK